MELEQEKFEAVKELSKIQTALSTGRAELAKLESEKDSYLEEREEETKKRVKAVLVSLKDALAQADTYKKELEQYRSSVESFVSEVRDIVSFLSHIREELHSEFEAFDEYSRGIMSELNTLSASVKREQSNLHAERESLETDKARMREDVKRLKDKEGVVNRKIERLKQGKI